MNGGDLGFSVYTEAQPMFKILGPTRLGVKKVYVSCSIGHSLVVVLFLERADSHFFFFFF